MNVKEIAEVVGKDERTIQRWVKKVSDKMSSINDKMSLSSPQNPADYELNEVIAIIEQGMGKNASLIFKTNAELQKKKYDIIKQENNYVTKTELEENNKEIYKTIDKKINYDLPAILKKHSLENSTQLLHLTGLSNGHISYVPKSKKLTYEVTQNPSLRRLSFLITNYSHTSKESREMVLGRLYNAIYNRIGIKVEDVVQGDKTNIECLEAHYLLPIALHIAEEIFSEN